MAPFRICSGAWGSHFSARLPTATALGGFLALCGIRLCQLGLLMMSVAAALSWLYLGGGVLIGLGIASASFGIVLAAFARNVAPEQRSIAFGFGTAAGSAGMFLFAPLSQSLD